MLFKAYRVTFTVPTHKDDKHSLLQLNDPLQIMVKYHKHNFDFLSTILKQSGLQKQPPYTAAFVPMSHGSAAPCW